VGETRMRVSERRDHVSAPKAYELAMTIDEVRKP
jgi:hypothetical protein